MAMIRYDIHRLNNIGMLERGAYAKLGSDLFLVLLLGFTAALGTEFFDRKDMAAVLVASLDKTDRTTGTGPEDPTPFTIFLTQVCLCRL